MAACLGQALVNLARGDPSLATWWARWGFGRYDDDWYRQLFRPGTSHPCRGEITPSYALLTSDEVGAVHALFPDLKLILMVRDPKSRAWSSLRYWAAAGGPDLDERTVRRTVAKPGFLERGDYLRTLDTYLAHFPPRQVLIGFYDAIRADPLGLLDGVAEFLGVAAFTPARLSRAVVNPAPEQEIPPPIDELLDEVFEPTVADIRRRFGSYASNWGLGVGTSDERPGPAHCPATVHPRPPGARTA